MHCAGRVLAIYLAHSYAHTHKSLNSLPESLKGSDWALFETVRAHGLLCKLVSTYRREDEDDDLRDCADDTFPPFCATDAEAGELPDWREQLLASKVTWLEDRHAEAHTEPQNAYLAVRWIAATESTHSTG